MGPCRPGMAARPRPASIGRSPRAGGMEAVTVSDDRPREETRPASEQKTVAGSQSQQLVPGSHAESSGGLPSCSLIFRRADLFMST